MIGGRLGRSLSRPPARAALRIAVGYALFGAAWIFFSDAVVARLLGHDLARHHHVQTLKGWGFVIATAVMLYVLIRRTFTVVRSAERARLESEARTELLVERVRDYAIFTLDPAGNVTSWNRGAQQITDWREEEIVGRPYATFFRPADAAAGEPQRMLAAAAASGWAESDESIRVRQDASEFWASTLVTALHEEAARHGNATATVPAITPTAATPAAGHATTTAGAAVPAARSLPVSGFLVVLRDVTEFRRARDALRQANQTLATVIGSSPLAIVTLDTAGNVTSWNAAAEKLYGWSAAEVIGRPPPIIPPERLAHFHENTRRLAAGEGLSAVDVQGIRKDGSRVDVALWAAPLTDVASGGRIVGNVRLYADVTQRKAAEAEILRWSETLERRVKERTARLEEANEELAAFSYTVSHDLRIPLRSLQQLAGDLLRKHGDALPDDGRADALRIVGAAARMERHIEELLEFSRVSRGELRLEPVSLVLIVHELLGRLERDPLFASAQVSVHEPLGWVLAHRLTLQQVILNLLVNAITFVAPGTRPVVNISARPLAAGERSATERSADAGAAATSEAGERTSASAAGGRGSGAPSGAGAGAAWLRLCIEDNGIGISHEDRERVFHVFERLPAAERYPGLGVGLTVARRGVERMGGRITVEPADGGGTRFCIDLPRASQGS